VGKEGKMNNAYLEVPSDLRGSLFLLGSRLISYPDDSANEDWKRIAEDYDLLKGAEIVDSENWNQCLDQLRSKLEEARGLDDWRSEYVSVFDTGREANPLHETEYGKSRSMTKGAHLADISGFYKAFGFSLDDKKSYREMPDHLAVELEFYGLLLLKEHHLREIGDGVGVKTVQDAQMKFLKEHLGTFIGALRYRPGICSSSLFAAIANWIAILVEEESRRLGVEPKKVIYATDEKEPDLMCCDTKLGGSKPCA
jgi:nitrate reductase assembly molybdenum cofactor insertion protein NarJ